MEKTYAQVLSSRKEGGECDDGGSIKDNEFECDKTKNAECNETSKRDVGKSSGERSGICPAGRSAADFDSRSFRSGEHAESPDVFPSPYERKIYEAICRNRRNYIERWRREWGEKPQGFREGRDFHYWWWRRTYIGYLRVIYDRLMKKMKSYKDVSFKKINLDDFVELAYINSSGYIIKHT